MIVECLTSEAQHRQSHQAGPRARIVIMECVAPDPEHRQSRQVYPKAKIAKVECRALVRFNRQARQVGPAKIALMESTTNTAWDKVGLRPTMTPT